MRSKQEKSKGPLGKSPEHHPKTNRKPGNKGEKKKSTLEDFFEELEKEFNPEEYKRKDQNKSEVEPFPPVEDVEYIRKQNEMQRAAEEEYAKARSGIASDEGDIIKHDLSKRKKRAPFNPRKAYMYKELLDRKHFDI